MSIKAAIETVQKIVPDLMATAVIPGVSIAIVHNQEIWQAQWGVMNASTNRPVTADTIFQAASLGKPLFAYAVLQLVVADQLDLDRPLITYLPASQQEADLLFDHIVNEPNLHKITARHVLCHTPGFPNWAKKGEKLKTGFIPGTRFSYSGEGYHFLQRLVEQIVGQSAHDWIRKTVLTPLGMADASFTAAKTDGHVAYGHDKSGQPAEFWEIAQMGAAFSLHGTAAAYAQFLLAALRPSPVTDFMLTPQTEVNDSISSNDDWPNLNAPLDPQVSWGLGWGLQDGENGRFFWQWGDNGTFKAITAGQMASGTAVVIFSNSQNGAKLWRPILETTFGTQQWPALDWLNRT